MTTLKEKVTSALNEARILILGAQILLGFQLNATFQPGFERLPRHGQWLDGVALALMAAAVALLIAPAPFHRLAERSHDTARLHLFTTRVTEAALLPVACAMGIDVFIVAERLFPPLLSVVAAIILAALAALCWYGLEAVQRARKGAKPMRQQAETEETATSIGERITTLLTEARVILPGAQALLGFQFTAFLTDGFERLPESAKRLHFASLCAVALSIILLMAPAAYHRLVARGENDADVDRFGSAVMLLSLIPLALGLCGEIYVVVQKLAAAAAPAVAGIALALFALLWLVLPLLLRARRTA